MTYSRPFCCRLIPPKMFREWKALFLEGLPIYEDEVVYLTFYSLNSSFIMIGSKAKYCAGVVYSLYI